MFYLRVIGATVGWMTVLLYGLVTMTGNGTSIPIEPLGPPWLGYVLLLVAFAMPFGGIGVVAFKLSRPAFRWWKRLTQSETR